MIRPILAPQADLDIFEMGMYIARDNEPAAIKFINALHDQFQRLAEFPGIGTLREELGSRVRSCPVGSHLIIDRPVRKIIEVIRVLRGHRDIDAVFELES